MFIILINLLLQAQVRFKKMNVSLILHFSDLNLQKLVCD